MKYINDRPQVYGMTLKYSTPATYVEAVHSHNLTWDVKTDDFFPYADRFDLLDFFQQKNYQIIAPTKHSNDHNLAI